MSSSALISIITPTYNRASFLKETIDSVLMQDDGGLEYLIIDDGSSDGTAELVKAYHDRTIYHYHDNMGETATVNRGIGLCRGEWIAIVNSDDPLLPGWLAAMRRAIAANPEAKLIYPDWLRTDARGNILEIIKQPDYTIANMLPSSGHYPFSCTIGPGMLLRRSLYGELGLRRTDMRCGADIDLIYRAALMTPLVHLPQVLATHREHPGTLSSQISGFDLACSLSGIVRRVIASPLYPENLKKNSTYTLLMAHLVILLRAAGRSRRARVAMAGYSALYALRCLPAAMIGFVRSSLSRLIRLLPFDRWVAALARRRTVQHVVVEIMIALLRLFYWRGKLPHPTPQTVMMTGPSFPPDFSGQAVVLGRLFEQMKGIDLCIATTQRPDNAAASNHLFLPPAHQASGMIARLRICLIQLHHLAKLAQRQRPEVVVACSADVTLPVLSWLVARAAGARFYFYQFDDYVHQWWASPGIMRLAAFCERLIATRLAGFIVPCDELGQLLRGRFPSAEVHVVANPCDAASLESAPPARDIRSNQAPVLAFTGSVYHLNERLMRALVRALELLPQPKPVLQLYSGIPSERLAAMGMTGSQLQICGYAKPQAIASILAGVDVAVICLSLDEDSRILVNSSATAKLADYLAAGKVILVLAPRDSYVAHYVARHDCGMVCDSHDPAAIAGVLSRHLSNPSWMAEARARARQCAERDFNPAHAAAALKLAWDSERPIRQMQRAISASAAFVKTRRDMNIVQITSMDQPGAQANGMLLHQYYRARGLGSSLLVHQQRSNLTGVHELGGGMLGVANDLAVRLERRLSLHHQFGLLAGRLRHHPTLKHADIVHVQLAHATSFTSWQSLAGILEGKRVVWTIHDMYMFTGHCVYSLGCTRWQSGCGQCPDFDIPFTITRDTTAGLYRHKHAAFERVRPQLVVASSWMDAQVAQSPMLREFPRTRIPFGTLRNMFYPRDKAKARARFNIPEDAQVISLRSVPLTKNFKGMEMIEEALRRYKPKKPTYLLTFQEKSGLDLLRATYQFVELGWTEDQELMALAHSATDVFLMPSSAEAFGIMAIEAQACGAPVIVAEGTALPETAGAPEACLVVPQGNAEALAAAIARIMDEPELRRSLGEAGLSHVKTRHDFVAHAEAHLDLYEAMMAAP
jgi:glycosyltransferase involved in cell wall biosynthesis